MMIWGIKYAFHGTSECEELLQDGWEPFAIIAMEAGWRVWFRKSVKI